MRPVKDHVLNIWHMCHSETAFPELYMASFLGFSSFTRPYRACWMKLSLLPPLWDVVSEIHSVFPAIPSVVAKIFLRAHMKCGFKGSPFSRPCEHAAVAETLLIPVPIGRRFSRPPVSRSWFLNLPPPSRPHIYGRKCSIHMACSLKLKPPIEAMKAEAPPFIGAHIWRDVARTQTRKHLCCTLSATVLLHFKTPRTNTNTPCIVAELPRNLISIFRADQEI